MNIQCFPKYYKDSGKVSLKPYKYCKCNFNTALFDNVSLRKEPAQTYHYDDKGNPISATQAGAGTENAAYTGVDLTQYTAANSNKYTYTYNAKHDILTATAAGIKNTYTYDTSGNATSSKLTSTDTTNTAYLYSSATMSDDRNHTLSVTDTAGKTTTYDYNKYYHFLNSTTNANNVTTNYAYFTGNGRMQQTYQSGVAAVTYTYSGGQLSSLDRKTFRNGAEQHQYYNFAYNLWGQNTSISVGSTELASYEYEAINSAAAGGGNLTKMTYGNGDSVSYTYDEFDRLVKTVYNDTGNYILYAYNAEGAVARLTYKSSANATLADYSFEYDSLGRLIRSAQYGANSVLAQRTEHLYDEYNRLYIQRWDIGGKTRSEKYTYNDRANGDGSLTQFKAGSGHKINYNYDPLRRLGNASVTNSSGTELFKTAYAYAAVSGDQTSTRVEYRNVRTTEGDLIFGYKYAYDNLGNITVIAKSEGTPYPLVKYTYDSQNQLVKEEHYDGTGDAASHITDTYTYTYDTAGNIISETKTSGGTTTSKNYTYGNSNWRDLLTAVNGTAISYDSNGDLKTYYNGNKTYTNLTWQHGRQLTSITVDGATASYAYDMDGIRSQKLVNGVVHSYVTQNGKVVRESFPYGDTTIIMDFIYDEAGRPFCVAYSKDGGASYTNYFYAVNAQGDVEGIFRVIKNDETGLYEQKWYGRYVYDAWGNVTATTAAGGKPSATSLVVRNPLRYRGYVYDNETGFYYIQSRYYDPANHRFISADAPEYSAMSAYSLNDTNLFTYCGNNPISRADDGGEFWHIIIGGAVGFTSGFVSTIVSDWRDEEKEVNIWKALAIGSIEGAEGALTAAFPAAAVAFSAAGAATVTLVEGLFDRDQSIGKVAVDSFISGGFGALTGSFGSDFSNKDVINDGAKAIKKLLKKKGMHPNVKKQCKKAAKKAVNYVRKAIFSGAMEDEVYSHLEDGTKDFVKFYFGMS